MYECQKKLDNEHFLDLHRGGGGRNPIPSDEWGSDLPSQHGGGLDPPSDLKTVRGWENLALWMVKEPDIRPKLLENT